MTDAATAARLTRRTLLVALGAGVAANAAGAAPGIAASSASPRRRTRELDRAQMSDWSALVGDRFDVAGGGSLRLVAVEPLCSGGPTPSRSQCFAALFEAAGGPVPEGGRTYALASSAAAPMALFLGARAEVHGRARFVAVFN